MPPTRFRGRAERFHQKADTSSDGDEENTPPDSSFPVQPTQPPKPSSLKVQLAEKTEQITQLEVIISDLKLRLLQLQNLHSTCNTNSQCLVVRNEELSAENQSLRSIKRKAEDDLSAALTKKHKRIKRLELEREKKAEATSTKLSDLQDSIDRNSSDVPDLEQNLASATRTLASRDSTIASLHSSLNDQRLASKTLRDRLYASQKQTQRAKKALKVTRKAYRELQTWNPRENGEYSADARALARDLTYAGCAAGKVEFAVRSCARTFGIEIRGKFMSRRTVGRSIDEGGKFGEIQLAREILEAPGFVESSDGTTHRGITVESRHVTLLVPSYAAGVDDADKSTWTHRTRFVEVAPALDHTGQSQFDGTMEAAHRIADTYTRSPLSAQENRVMEKNDYLRKKLGECKDHAADGKKEFKISAERKKEIVTRDLGRAAMDDADMATGVILLKIAEITNEELEAAGKISPSELAALPSAERTKLVEEVLELKIGEEKLDSLTEEQRCDICTHVFGGCCCHKDLNVVRYGTAAIEKLYTTHDIPRPVLLANKANSATIALSSDNPDNPALQHAMESSTAGAVKLLQLIGALLRHKDGERGYQDKCTIFMQERKRQQFDLIDSAKFPDISNTRYGCYTYGAAEVVVFHGIIYELVTEIVDAKTKSGQKNHVEKLILMGLDCTATMTELVALALYGASVSWPYMAMVRGTKEHPVNLLSLTDLHRKLPVFCDSIAANPAILWDQETPPDQLTISGRPFLNKLLIPTILELLLDLPNLVLVTSTMFSGCAEGWVHFTPEFNVGGTFDRLTPEQRGNLWIPSTNDHNEGKLGSYRDHMKDKPNSTAHSFSSRARLQTNNTEAFIKKFCDAVVRRFVMRDVRKDGASGARAKFRKAYLALQRQKAEKALKRRETTAARKKAAAAKLATTSLEMDVQKIRALSSKALKDQLQVYKDVLKDPILTKLLWKNMATVAVRRDLVLAARERELERKSGETIMSQAAADTSEPQVIEEFGYSPSDDAEWEDLDEDTDE